MWRFLALRYCVRYHFRAFGNRWVSASFIGALRAPLHVLVVLLCSAYRACSCSLLFKAFWQDFVAHSFCGQSAFTQFIGLLRCLDFFSRGCGARWRFLSEFVFRMSQPRSTFNSLSAGLFLTSSSSALSFSAAAVTVTVALSISTTSMSSESAVAVAVAVAVAHALENLALLGRLFDLRSASLPSLLQQSASLHPAVLQLRPTPSPRQARGALCLPVHLGY